MSAVDGRRPTAVTMGDPAGIGPEIVIDALSRTSPAERHDVLVLGDVDRLRRAAAILGVELRIERVDGPEHRGTDAEVRVVQVGSLPADLPFGQIDATAGARSFEYVTAAVAMALNGTVSAVVTAPINKEAWSRGGVPFPDHTSALVSLTGARRHAMMLATDELRSVLVTVHLSLRQALDALSETGILRTIEITHDELRSQGISSPRIAVAALNPHAGENGLFGDEEITLITPAVEAARRAGIDATGPYPADTVFMRARRGEFDAVVAMFHDQGLTPIKLLGIDDGVNVTLGLPIIRTSVDHGTAMDIAGRGVASGLSLQYAITNAHRLVEAKTRNQVTGQPT
ncbi:4-hydroxythreonine-4-phosphate dehydrogenase PdxA [Streptomyces antimycoticus]|uniref:4-hydroxythreonine-4-phosphate dehydrogenase PdxA n=1 Tax=Streptomyces antimycoticus TaxID=68175 RepID=UPI00191BB00F|nr:4-hydroxythreonine-4-phosphate dehydrogenase PdxA [Streptomyces antimycoticus]